ncbi:unnamed protein product [marine sediment metagenome]|uniref:Uncharacterized protein n=1 Tax=marine sediment metagenome TaxID=412755 RepID=X0RHQ3_9ZZZZ
MRLWLNFGPVTNRKFTFEDYLLAAGVVVIVGCILFFLLACSSKEIHKLDVLWICPDGVFHATGTGFEQFGTQVDKMDFSQCQVSSSEEMSGKSIPLKE